jgi:hypothetical protein
MKPSTKKWIIKGIISCFLIFLLLVFTGCESGGIPDDLIGMWVSDDERYENCFMKISSDSIVFGQAGNQTDTYSIIKVGVVNKSERQVLKIKSVSSDKIVITHELLFSPKNGGQLQFKNRPSVLWYRQLRLSSNALIIKNLCSFYVG